MEAIRFGQMTAWREPDGGVRGIVVGDIVRRLVARTIAKQVSKQAEKATAPCQCATKAGCECVAHILQDDRPRQSSNRGLCRWCRGVRSDLQEPYVGMEGLVRMEGGDQILRTCGKTRWVRHKESHKGGRGAGRPPHAHALCSGPASSTGGRSEWLA